ncbi:MAG TPA: sigma-70 family RNA polymerase sigma factor [Vicinamibacterales bacterium]|nr:sigma-70 family RNA polymerase sigma factor [Vicinamibacterales bacterium]
MKPPDAVASDERADADSTLVRAVAEGSAEALGTLYDRHAGSVFGLAKRILERQEDAEEVVQDVFAQVWREAPRYDAARATVAGWILVLARTRAIDRLRSRRARPDVNDGVDPASAPPLASGGRDPEHAAISNDEARKVRAAFVALPEPLRSLVDLAYFQGLTHSEIAGQTGVPLGTVKTRLRTAVAALRLVLTA